MGIRIKRIEIHSCGPLSSFNEAVAPLTVVYAKNEKGKTTIVENTVAALFKDRKDGMYPRLRGDEFVGPAKITVSGLSKGPQAFTPLNRKQSIDDMLEKDGALLPRSLFNLLFVRGAETAIIREQGGITKTALKNLISKQHIYGIIQRNIPNSVSYTEFINGHIVPKKNLGDYKTYEQAKARLDELLSLSDSFYSSLSQTDLTRFTLQRERLEAEREELEKAKRHYACSLKKKRQGVREELMGIEEGRLENITEKVRDYFRKREEYTRTRESLEQYKETTQDLDWIRSAQELYMKTLDQAVNRMQRLFLVIGTISLIPAVIFLFFNTLLSMPFLALSLLSLLITSVFTFFLKRSRTPESVRIEREQIRLELKKRFGRNLSSTADFAAAARELEQRLWKKEDLEKQSREMGSILATLPLEIRHAFTRMGLTEPGEERWLAIIEEMKRRRDRLNKENTEYTTRLETIGVDESDYREEPARIEYSKNREEEINRELARLAERIQQEKEKLKTLRNRIKDRIGYEIASSDNLEKISEVLEKKIHEERASMNDALAKMIAAHVVSKVIEEFKKREDERLEEYINSSEIVHLLREFTAKYDVLYLGEGEEIFVGSEVERYDLRNISTGAQEQILLALRIGIARKLSGKESLFLILDDAFQYSDWERRQRLIDQAVEIVKAGWQVLYFTMDDDIKNRFIASAKSLSPKEFKLIEL